VNDVRLAGRTRALLTIGGVRSKMKGRPFSDGPVAQLGARLNGIQEVTGSIPVRSTISKLLILMA
jgi:hypothetical protein